MKAEKQRELKYSKDDLLQGDRYQGKKDLLSALLEDNKEYSLAETDAVIEKFLKGKVR